MQYISTIIHKYKLFYNVERMGKTKAKLTIVYITFGTILINCRSGRGWVSGKQPIKKKSLQKLDLQD